MDLGGSLPIHLHILVFLPVFFYTLLRVYVYPSHAAIMRPHP